MRQGFYIVWKHFSNKGLPVTKLLPTILLVEQGVHAMEMEDCWRHIANSPGLPVKVGHLLKEAFTRPTSGILHPASNRSSALRSYCCLQHKVERNSLVP